MFREPARSWKNFQIAAAEWRMIAKKFRHGRIVIAPP
jgi:hypothetical protein